MPRNLLGNRSSYGAAWPGLLQGYSETLLLGSCAVIRQIEVIDQGVNIDPAVLSACPCRNAAACS